jgi:NAD-dependent dihydropyrimidine dehydrogenase PreA subunit
LSAWITGFIEKNMFWKRKDLIANVIEDKCDNCKRCVEICRRRAMVMATVQNKTVTFVNRPEKCSGCGKCMKICPKQAIELIERYG